MANHKSAIKRAKQNEIRRNRNRSRKTRIKKIVKQVRLAADSNPDESLKILNAAKSEIHRGAKTGVIHKNTASRKISRLTKLINRRQSA